MLSGVPSNESPTHAVLDVVLEGQTTAHYLTDQLSGFGVRVTRDNVAAEMPLRSASSFSVLVVRGGVPVDKT